MDYFYYADLADERQSEYEARCAEMAEEYYSECLEVMGESSSPLSYRLAEKFDWFPCSGATVFDWYQAAITLNPSKLIDQHSDDSDCPF